MSFNIKYCQRKMRVFYEDYESKQYYVKIDNVNVPDNLKGYKSFEAITTKDLIKQIIEYYEFKNRGEFNIELWTNRGCQGMRLDMLDIIPKENEFLWARVVKHTN